MKKNISHIRWFAMAGLAISAYLLILHLNYDVLGGSCDVGSLFSCSVLLIKEYSQWFGVPVPVFSILFYLLVLGLAWGTDQSQKGRSSEKRIFYLYTLSLVALASTIAMAFIAFVKLKTICLFCTGLYIVSIFLFVWMRSIWKSVGRDWFSDLMEEVTNLHKNATAIKILLAMALVLAGSYMYFYTEQTIIVDHDQALMGRSVGNPKARVKIEVFSDFQCPACKHAVTFLYLLEKEMAEKIHITYKYYPLDSSCNASVGHNMHPQACKAAKASFCASLQNKFWRYHDFLFQNQLKLHDGIYQEIAEREGLKIGEFLQCMQSQAATDAVEADIAQGNLYDVRATPTIMVNGQSYEGKRTVADFQAFIDKLK